MMAAAVHRGGDLSEISIAAVNGRIREEGPEIPSWKRGRVPPRKS